MPDPAGVKVIRFPAAGGDSRGLARLPGLRVGLLPSVGSAPAGRLAIAVASAVSSALPRLLELLVARSSDWPGRG
jgi:hypothetical protein